MTGWMSLIFKICYLDFRAGNRKESEESRRNSGTEELTGTEGIAEEDLKERDKEGEREPPHSCLPTAGVNDVNIMASKKNKGKCVCQSPTTRRKG